MTEKELRKHIKPYLRFAIKRLENCEIPFLCLQITYYVRNLFDEYTVIEKHEIQNYLKGRLTFARPLDSGGQYSWYEKIQAFFICTNPTLRVNSPFLQGLVIGRI